jgi:hypothetical protein
MAKNKYNNKKVVIDGIKFDSKKEASQYIYYKHQKAKSEIKDFKMQVPFELIPSQKDFRTQRIIERACIYRCDFVINNLDGSTEYIEVKGWDKKKRKFITTKDYIIKRKLMLYKYGIKLKEV